MRKPAGDDSTLRPPESADTQPLDSLPAEGRRAATPIPVLPGYQLGEVIGRGGMGEVIAAVDQTLGREVALKRMLAQELSSVSNLVVLYAAATLMAVVSWHNGKTGRTPVWVMMGGNLLLTFAFSRLTGSFVLTAALVCGQAVALSTRRDIAVRKWPLIVWVIAAMMGPIILEYFHVLERTWEMTSHGLLTHGKVVETTHERDVVFLTIGQTALAIAVSMFAMATTRSREEAHRRAHIQAWHMRQLIPGGRLPTTPVP